MIQLQIFKYESEEDRMFKEIRTVEIDGEIWFVASDVSKALGYLNISDSIKRHCKSKGIVKHDILTNGGNQEVTLINEPLKNGFLRKFAHVDPCAKCNAAQPTLAPDALRVCGKCGLSEQNHADSLCNPNYSAGKA